MAAIHNIDYPSTKLAESDAVRAKDLWVDTPFKKTFSDVNKDYKGSKTSSIVHYPDFPS